MRKEFSEYGASWIWIKANEQDVNQYVEFRQEFIIKELPNKDVDLFISADSNYAVWINGVFVNCGQFNDYPDSKTYDTLAVGKLLKCGKNVIGVLAYYQGRTSFSYLKGEPGLLFALVGEGLSAVSDSRTYSRNSQTYTNGSIYDTTFQLSFAFGYDATNGDAWLQNDYIMEEAAVERGWKPSKVLTVPNEFYHAELSERPLKKLDIKDRSEIKIIAQGKLIRVPEEGKTPAQLVQADFLSSCTSNEFAAIDPALFRENEGVYYIIDLGREEAGLFEMEVETDEGTIIDIAYGEHLDDLRVRAYVGERNFANRYVCCEGHQAFTHYFRRFGCRYIELHVLKAKTKFILHYAGLRPTDYPIEERGRFTCSDSLYRQIYQTSVRTLELCMHEHYEDCPWREQALYGMDSRNQALCGYYCFGEYDFPEVSFSLLAKSYKEDGYLELVAPSEFERTIPSFSMAWVLEVWELYLYSGRLEPVRRSMPVIEKMLGRYMENMNEGLMVTPQGKRQWNFYEWADGLDGCTNSEAVNCTANQYDAPLNLFFHIALNAAAKLAEALGKVEKAKEYRSCAAGIRECFHKKFWVESKQVYQTYVGGIAKQEHFAELTQALALYAGVCPEHIASELRQKLADEDNGLVKTTLSYSIYKFEALLGEPDKYAETVFDTIAKDWGYMLYHGATSFWETIKGGDDFEKAGSLCHGWSAIPVYFYYAYILGVKPVEPGFKTIEVKPVHNRLLQASGKVPTPYGIIQVDWDGSKLSSKINISVPEGICIKKD